MTDNILYIYLNSTGNLIKSRNLEIIQYSTNNRVRLITVGRFAAIKATFVTGDKKLSDAYHMIECDDKYQLTEEDTESVLINNANNLYMYDLVIPYKVTSSFIYAGVTKIMLSFNGAYEDNGFLKNVTSANIAITTSMASVAPTLDQSYSAADVENLWKDTGNLHNTKYDKSGGTISGDVHITGDLEVDGDTTLHDVTIDEITVEEVNVDTLNATDATITNLDATNADIDNLDATSADITTLTATTATIGTNNVTTENVSQVNATRIDADKIYVDELHYEEGSAEFDALTVNTINGMSVGNILPSNKLVGNISDASEGSTAIPNTTQVKEFVNTHGGKIDKIKVNDVEQQIVDKTVNISVPTAVSQLTNDSNYQTNTQVAASISSHNNDSLENVHPEIREFIEDEIENRELACGALSDRLDAVEEVIPEQATSENQLADKAFVNSSIENLAAFYVTKKSNNEYVPFNTKNELNTITTVYINGVAKTPGKNDYAIVLADESKQGTAAQAPTTRYMYPKSNTVPYDPTAWEFQYIVNNTGLTAAQVAALNSGITASLVSDLNSNTAARHTHDNKTILDGIASTNLVSSSDRTNWNNKSTVSASSTGSSVNDANYLTVDGTEWKLSGSVTDVKINNTSILSDKIANIPIASNNLSNLGVVKVNSNRGIGSYGTDGTICIIKADDSIIEARNNSATDSKKYYTPIVPANLDKAVMEGLGNYNLGTNNANAWTDTYKTHAREVIGAQKSIEIEVLT